MNPFILYGAGLFIVGMIEEFQHVSWVKRRNEELETKEAERIMENRRKQKEPE